MGKAVPGQSHLIRCGTPNSKSLIVRNPFDQYDDPENRLTHALACSLAEDRGFLAAFVRWATGERPPSGSALLVEEQTIPGRLEEVEDKPERRGLPDAWIHDGDEWCLLVESKVASKIDQSQIQRHLRTAERHGFTDRRIVVLSLHPHKGNGAEEIHHQTWRDLYRLALQGGWKTVWPTRLAGYMIVAEGRMVAAGYLTEGTLTSFEGLQFDRDTPYSYREAKRALGLLIGEMRTRRQLAEKLGADLEAPGRKAITGTGANSVWNFLRLGGADGDDAFTKRPHLTLSIQWNRALVQVTVPNGVEGGLRKALVGLGPEGFGDVLGKVLKGARSVLAKEPAAVPYLMLLQRHYPSQRSEGIVDGRLEFDLRTAFADEESPVKGQPEWLDLAYHAFAGRRSNMQLSVGISFPYDSCESVRQRGFADMVEKSWLACSPLLEAMGLI